MKISELRIGDQVLSHDESFGYIVLSNPRTPTVIDSRLPTFTNDILACIDVRYATGEVSVRLFESLNMELPTTIKVYRDGKRIHPNV